MFSLAPLFYRDVLASNGGPVNQIVSGQFPILGKNTFQATAFLKPGLTPAKPTHELYSNGDGTGSSENPVVAQHMAVSEALERWAYFQARHDDPKSCGWDVDPSTNGMAAFPGFAFQARKRARLEALERFSVVGWWDGKLDATVSKAPLSDRVGLVRINHGQDFGEVVILYVKSKAGFYAYGHAAGSNLATATGKAAIELVRNELVIAQYRSRGALFVPRHFFERRLIHFSTEAGHAQFKERLERGAEKPAPQWKTVYDGEVKGGWSKFAKVWRHAVEMPSMEFLNPKADVFFW